MGRFATVSDERIQNGECTDIYFERTEEILDATGRNPRVEMEITAGVLPGEWAVFCGLDDVISLLEDKPISVMAMPEGSIFYPNEPVMRISGRYRDFARFETSILGFLCHASGIATAALGMKLSARGRSIYSFGSRRQHPAISAMVERSAWIGGVDGASNTCSPEGIPLAGTMPHSFVICYPAPEDAFSAFARHAPKDVPRVMLCDTYCDEKRESLTGARCGATAVRLDTPRSRRGDMRAILEEVRWELDSEGFSDVGIFLSGGITRNDIEAYRDIVDSFGVGGAIANAPVIDFGMDIVEIDGEKCAKRGKRSGAKQVYLQASGMRTTLLAESPAPPGAAPLLKCFIREGRVVSHPSIADARRRVLSQMEKMAKTPSSEKEA
jgi:nicotinate phosphoribosyltransferase